MSSEALSSLSSTLFMPVPVGQTNRFGERALIGLFRGAGELLGLSGSSDLSGIDTLHQRLQQAFPDYFLISQVFDSYTGNVFSFREVGSQQALDFVNPFQLAAIGLIGYSAGGLSTIRTARGLASQAIDLTVQVDSYEPLTGNSSEDEVLPANVVKGINYYQRANRLNPFQPGFNPTDLQGATNVQGAENINAEELFGDRSLTHRNIINYTPLQESILQNIETYVLQDLEFAAPGELALQGGAQLLNNLLRLTPGGSHQPGQALLADYFAVDQNFSFQTQFEFRLPPAAASPSGFSFVIDSIPIHSGATGLSDLTIAFNPLPFSAANPTANTVALFAPELTPAPLALAAAPLDFDTGTPLTAWVNYDGSTDRLQVFLNNSDTQPTAPLLEATLDLPAAVGSLAQFGFATTVNGNQRQADILTWDWSSTAATGSSSVDLLWRNASTGQTLFWLQHGDPTQSGAALPTVPAEWNLEGLADFDRNGSRDLLWRQQNSGETVIWLMDGISLQTAVQLPAPPPIWQIQTLADLDQNGSDDILWRQPETGQNRVWLMDQTVPQQAVALLTVPSGWEIGGTADIDDDGDPDLLWRNANTGHNRFWRMAGIQSQEAIGLPNVPSEWQIAGLADFNGNGSDDIFWRRPVGEQTVIWYMTGATLMESAFLPSAPASWELIV